MILFNREYININTITTDNYVNIRYHLPFYVTQILFCYHKIKMLFSWLSVAKNRFEGDKITVTTKPRF